MHRSDIDDSMSGTTAIIARVKGRKLHVCNVGRDLASTPPCPCDKMKPLRYQMSNETRCRKYTEGIEGTVSKVRGWWMIPDTPGTLPGGDSRATLAEINANGRVRGKSCTHHVIG